jgi:hypothetical protein
MYKILTDLFCHAALQSLQGLFLQYFNKFNKKNISFATLKNMNATLTYFLQFEMLEMQTEK